MFLNGQLGTSTIIKFPSVTTLYKCRVIKILTTLIIDAYLNLEIDDFSYLMKKATVSVEQGILKGGKAKNDNGFEYYEFLGVPYAKPPVGELRFKSPETLERWEGVRDVTVVNKNNIGLQVDMVEGQVAGSEDCLYLNVYTPKLPEDDSELLPVMVFIHGGGFVSGNGILKDEHGPEFLIEHNTVVVTINYRLSVFGFLALDIPEAAGNMGLKDQRKALEWVQNNISKFSGDKNNVTIFGISAGGASVEYHIVSEKSKGLFHKAIQHSGSCLNHWSVNYEPKKLAYKLAKDLGYNDSLDDSFALYEFLLKAPAKALATSAFKVTEIYTSDRLFFGFVPTIEKKFGNGEEFLTEQPYLLLKEGRFNRVPVIKGFCNKEGYLVNVLKPKAILNLLAKRNFTDHWSFDLDANDQSEYNRKLTQVYSEDLQPDDDHDKMAVDFFGDYDFVSGIWLSGKLTARHGVPVRVYEFSYDGKINFFKLMFGITRKGAAHGDDHTYVLCHKIARVAYDQDLVVRNTMSKMWTSFAKFSNPTPENDQEWPLSKEDNALYLNFDKRLTLKKDYESKKIDIFEEVYEKYEK